MTRTLLPGLTTAILAFSCVTAQASPADEMTLSRLTDVNGIAQSGAVPAEFIQGHAVVAQRINQVIPAATARADEQAMRYQNDNMVLTFAMLALAAIAFIGMAVLSRMLGKGASSEAARPEGWREDLMGMLEADLRNLDNLMHGLPGR